MVRILIVSQHFFGSAPGPLGTFSFSIITTVRVSDPDPHSNCGSGSGSRRAKMTHKNRKKSRILMFLSTTGCSLLRAEGFSCRLGVLYRGLGISKLQFLIKEKEIKFPAKIFFSILGPQTLDPDPGSRSGFRIRN
jgi:hypothetical protein